VPFSNSGQGAVATSADPTVKNNGTMSFKPANPEALNILLPLDEFPMSADERAKISSMTMLVKMASVSTNSATGENQVRLFVQLFYRKSNGRTLSREFTSETTATLKGAGAEDTLTGNLKDILIDDTAILSIKARRKASGTLEEARKNAFTGSLILRKDGKEISLGTIEGFQVFTSID